jgi:hypothetical protein
LVYAEMVMTDKHDRLIEHLRGLRKIVINADWGGFGLSDEAWQRYCEFTGQDHTDENLYHRDTPRDDPYLVKVVEEMGSAANGDFADLKIVEIPADVEWQIGEYDGREWVAEKHRTWR